MLIDGFSLKEHRMQELGAALCAQSHVSARIRCISCRFAHTRRLAGMRKAGPAGLRWAHGNVPIKVLALS
jgi:hypothetical protein